MISTLKNNITLLKIQRKSLQRSLEMMDDNWGTYTNEAGYQEKQAVSDKNIVTANGTGHLEFTRELLLLLHADTPEKIDAAYDYYKNGFVR